MGSVKVWEDSEAVHVVCLHVVYTSQVINKNKMNKNHVFVLLFVL